MYAPLKAKLQAELAAIREAGTYKNERIIVSPQAAHIQVRSGAEVINFCANNYLGLANDPRLVAAARRVMEDHGFGMASVRFICGTQDIHKQLEGKISAFLGTDDTILYTSCFDANGQLKPSEAPGGSAVAASTALMAGGKKMNAGQDAWARMSGRSFGRIKLMMNLRELMIREREGLVEEGGEETALSDAVVHGGAEG